MRAVNEIQNLDLDKLVRRAIRFNSISRNILKFFIKAKANADAIGKFCIRNEG